MISSGATHLGQFLPGQAIGIALLVGELNGATTVFQWGRTIELVSGP
jgi:hypothetical protein